MTHLSLFQGEDGEMASVDVSTWPKYLLKRINLALVEIVADFKTRRRLGSYVSYAKVLYF